MSWHTVVIGVTTTLLLAYLVFLNTLSNADSSFYLLHTASRTPQASIDKDDFPTNIGFLGPTKTGTPTSLRNNNPKSGPNNPFVINYKVEGQSKHETIQQYWGSLSPYFISDGFGVADQPLPKQCKVKQAHILSRHGARYPTAFSSLLRFADKLEKSDFKAKGALQMLNDWSYGLGEAILVPIGKQQLYDSGVLASMLYGGLYNHTQVDKKLVFRTTTQKRMTESGLAFLEGFFGGQDWRDHANLELIIEASGYNNTLSPYQTCTNSNKQMFGSQNRRHWENIYLANKTEQFADLISGLDWTVEDTAALQLLCPYETVANGYSAFCELFDFEEWKGFDYAESLWFEQNCAFGAPTGRAQGIGWTNELIRRIEGKAFDYSVISSENSTLDADEKFFPLDQNIYVDFTHDSVISSVVAALDFKQFSKSMPKDGPGEGESYYSTSKITPFAARLYVEIIDCEGEDYIHFLLNQQTVPVGEKYGKGYRAGDGWARLDSWLAGMENRNALADWNFACYGDYPTDGIDFTDGSPHHR